MQISGLRPTLYYKCVLNLFQSLFPMQLYENKTVFISGLIHCIFLTVDFTLINFWAVNNWQMGFFCLLNAMRHILMVSKWLCQTNSPLKKHWCPHNKKREQVAFVKEGIINASQGQIKLHQKNALMCCNRRLFGEAFLIDASDFHSYRHLSEISFKHKGIRHILLAYMPLSDGICFAYFWICSERQNSLWAR